jgi:hypothetical protein
VAAVAAGVEDAAVEIDSVRNRRSRAAGVEECTARRCSRSVDRLPHCLLPLIVARLRRRLSRVAVRRLLPLLHSSVSRMAVNAVESFHLLLALAKREMRTRRRRRRFCKEITARGLRVRRIPMTLNRKLLTARAANPAATSDATTRVVIEVGTTKATVATVSIAKSARRSRTGH